jgi:hypothetical protein
MDLLQTTSARLVAATTAAFLARSRLAKSRSDVARFRGDHGLFESNCYDDFSPTSELRLSDGLRLHSMP